MDDPKDNPRILLVGFGPYKPWASLYVAYSEHSSYKDSTAVVLKKCGYDVIVTTDITVSGEGQALVDARRWISRNSLRRYHGEKVKVVCAMDGRTGVHDASSVDASWVDIMCLLFKKKHSPYVAAVMQNKGIASNKHMKRFFSGLDSSIVMETTNDNCDYQGSSNIVLENMDDACMPYLKRIIDDLEPIKIKTRSCIVGKDIKAWSNEKVILFGRTGSGKSTIAQMLTLGHLNAPGSDMKSKASSNTPSLPSTAFKASSNARGMTKDIARGEGRGWHVTDTPGFGEAKEGSTVSTKEATKVIQRFVIDTCGIYSHYLYVVKKDRMNIYDERLWKFFNKVFAGAGENFSVVVTGCSMELSKQDENYILGTFTGCKNFIYVDLPPVSNDSELEEENEEVRRVALRTLENELACLGIADKGTSEGEYSKENLRFVKSNNRASFSGRHHTVMDDMIAQLYNYLVVKPLAAVGGLLNKSKIDENFILLPM